MKSFKLITPERFLNTSNYQLVEGGIYNDLNDSAGFSTYRIAVAITFEEENFLVKEVDKQLESYFIHIEESLGCTQNNVYQYILGGELEDINSFLALQNKR